MKQTLELFNIEKPMVAALFFGAVDDYRLFLLRKHPGLFSQNRWKTETQGEGSNSASQGQQLLRTMWRNATGSAIIVGSVTLSLFGEGEKLHRPCHQLPDLL